MGMIGVEAAVIGIRSPPDTFSLQFIGIEPDRDRPGVMDLDEHVGLEFTRLHPESERAQSRCELFDQRRRHLRAP